MKSSSLENSIYDNNSNNSLLQQPNMLVTPYAKEDRTTTSMINSPTSSSNDENEEFNSENSNIYYPATNPLPSAQKKSSKRRSQVRNACGMYPYSTFFYYTSLLHKTVHVVFILIIYFSS